MNARKGWEIQFELDRPVLVDKVESIEGIEFEKDKNRIRGLTITSHELSELDAINYAEILCNRCLDYISFISNIPVSAKLKQMNEITTKDKKMGQKFFTSDALLEKPINVNFSSASFQRLLNYEDDASFALQLSHFKRGLKAIDSIEKIREFYQVLELEKSDLIEKYRYVRHMVSHPELTNKKSMREAIKKLGKSYFDPSSPKNMQAILNDAKQLQTEARKIIETKFGDS